MCKLKTGGCLVLQQPHIEGLSGPVSTHGTNSTESRRGVFAAKAVRQVLRRGTTQAWALLWGPVTALQYLTGTTAIIGTWIQGVQRLHPEELIPVQRLIANRI